MAYAERSDPLTGRLQAELDRRHMDYAELSARLQAIGIDASPETIERRLAQREAGATFVVQCFIALAADPVGTS